MTDNNIKATDDERSFVIKRSARKNKMGISLTREEVEIMCSDALRQMNRYLHGNGKKPDDFNERLKLYRMIANLARDYCKVIKDREIEEMYEIVKEHRK